MTDKPMKKYIVWHTETRNWEEIIEAKDETELKQILNNKGWQDVKGDVGDIVTEWELCDD